MFKEKRTKAKTRKIQIQDGESKERRQNKNTKQGRNGCSAEKSFLKSRLSREPFLFKIFPSEGKVNLRSNRFRVKYSRDITGKAVPCSWQDG